MIVVFACVRVEVPTYWGQHTGYGVLQACYAHGAACASVLLALSD